MNSDQSESQYYANSLKSLVENHQRNERYIKEKLNSIDSAFVNLNNLIKSFYDTNELASITQLAEADRAYEVPLGDAIKPKNPINHRVKVVQIKRDFLTLEFAPELKISNDSMFPKGTLFYFHLKAMAIPEHFLTGSTTINNENKGYKQSLDEQYTLYYVESEGWKVRIVLRKKNNEVIYEEFNNDSFLRILYSVFSPIL